MESGLAQEPFMFPIFLNLKGPCCLVVGSGAVGRRKATALLHADADVRLVSLEPRAPLDTARQPEWLQGNYREEHLEGVVLAFAAATPAVNDRVVADSRARGIWVNVADDPDKGDFYLPATLRRGGLAIAVSTGGAAPGLAAAIRDRLEWEFDDAFGQWIALLAEFRPIILERVTDPQRKHDLFAHLMEWSWLERLRMEGVTAVREAMLKHLTLQDRRE